MRKIVLHLEHTLVNTTHVHSLTNILKLMKLKIRRNILKWIYCEEDLQRTEIET